jgi:hypothetical protein
MLAKPHSSTVDERIRCAFVAREQCGSSEDNPDFEPRDSRLATHIR